jgi:hypothetical protein
LCGWADDVYRKTSRRVAAIQPGSDSGAQQPAGGSGQAARSDAEGAGLALRAAAMHAGEYESFLHIIATLRQQAPEVARTLGLI